MTALLAKLLGLDPVSIPIPIALMGVILDIALATLVVAAVWFTLRLAIGFAADVVEVQNLRQRLVVARGLTRHDFEQVRKAIRGWHVLMSVTARMITCATWPARPTAVSGVRAMRHCR
ncbi:MAG TPA: hypothetical protein VGH36_05945 [Acetobacteraceae bacterium]